MAKIHEVIRLKSTLLGDGSRWMEIEELTSKGTKPKLLARVRYKHRADTSFNVFMGYPKRHKEV